MARPTRLVSLLSKKIQPTTESFLTLQTASPSASRLVCRQHLIGWSCWLLTTSPDADNHHTKNQSWILVRTAKRLIYHFVDRFALHLEATRANTISKSLRTNSLYLLFQPADTGNPNHDLNTHLEKFANRSHSANDVSATNNRKFHTGNITRIDLESNPTNRRPRCWAALKSISDRQMKPSSNTRSSPSRTPSRNSTTWTTQGNSFASSPRRYAAGVEPDPRSLQIWTSWAYNEINTRYAQILRNNSGLAQRATTCEADAHTLAEFKATIIQEVLTELAVIAKRHSPPLLPQTKIVSLKKPKVFDRLPREEKLSPAERRDLFEQRYDEVMLHRRTRYHPSPLN